MTQQFKKMIVFDMDDTLSDFRTGLVPESAYRALEALRKRGDTLLVIASGRGHFFFKDSRPDLKVDAIVGLNGQCVSYQETIVYENGIDPDEVDGLKTLLADKKGGLYLLNSFKGLNCILPVEDAKMKHSHSVTRLKDYGPEYNEDCTIHLMQAAFEAEDDRLFESQFPQFSFHRYYDYMVDVFPKSSSKLVGLRKLAEYVNIDMQDVIAFGDGLNDMEMIEGVGFGVAMGNAHPELKKIADLVTDSVLDDGIEKALRRLALI